VARSSAHLADADGAVDLIEPWIDKVSPGWLLWMQRDNSLDPIREHLRFAALMARASRRLEADTGPTRTE
jgi:hypothetical protein